MIFTNEHNLMRKKKYGWLKATQYFFTAKVQALCIEYEKQNPNKNKNKAKITMDPSGSPTSSR